MLKAGSVTIKKEVEIDEIKMCLEGGGNRDFSNGNFNNTFINDYYPTTF